MEVILSDYTAIALCIAVIVMALVAPFFSPLCRLKRKGDHADDHELPPVSIIIASHEDAARLEKHLPDILQQDYPAGYEVIVVIEKGDHDVENVVKRIEHGLTMQPGNAHLYVTYIPETSRYMSRRKLAVTLGVKAAKNEWLLLVDSDCAPVSDRWLSLMARNCSEDKSMVMGYCNYSEDTAPFKRYERFYHFCYLLRESQKQAYRTNCSNLMFRKSQFMEANGYLGNLELVRGEYDFLVNKFSQIGRTASETSCDAWLVQDAPSRQSWNNAHIYYLETRKSLKRSFMHRLVFNVDQMVMRLCTLVIASGIVYSVLTHNWLLLGISVLGFVLEIVLRYIVDKKAIRNFGERFTAPVVLDHLIMWSNVYFLLRHRFSDRLNFTTHKQ